LKQNSLKTLPDNLFKEMKSLKILNLLGNCLKKVCLNGLSNLEELSIEFNRKVNIAETLGLFESLTSLKKLFIKFSQDEDEDEYDDDDEDDDEEDDDDEDDDDDDDYDKKKKPVADIRPANRITSDFFQGLSNLVELRIEEADNKLFEIDCFKYLQNLVKLKLEKCSINEIKRKHFTGLEKLEYLDLSNNRVESVEENSFSDLSSLKELNLSKNKPSIRDFNKKCIRNNIKLIL
jgi:Leucine-rich repeat (LRR) protein